MPALRFRSLTTAALLAVSASALLLAGGSAAQAAGVTTMRLEAAISGTQTVGWQYQTDGFPQYDRIWTKGAGTQSLSFQTAKPVRMQLVVARVPGHRMVALTRTDGTQPRLDGQVTRSGSWTPNAPALCGGELGDCSTLEAPAAPAPPDCGGRALPVSLTTLEAASASTAEPRIQLTALTSHPFAHCPPDQPDGGAVSDLQAASMGPIELPGLGRLTRLRRGASTTLEGSTLWGKTTNFNFHKECPKLQGQGFQQCVTTKVSVKFRRTR